METTMRSFFALLFLSLLAFTAAAGNDSSSVFVYTNPGTNQSLVFALSIDDSSHDLYMHFSAPSGNSWAGVGIGSKMKDSLFFIAYASKNGTGVTLSPRVADGHSEPSYYDGVSCELVYAENLADANTVTTGEDGTMTVDAVCRNATSWKQGSASGKLDLTSTTQDFIFAVGPGTEGHHETQLHSNSLSANLGRHGFYGHFTMDLTAAVSTSAQVPRPNSGGAYFLASATTATNTKSDHDPAPAIHAFIMCLSFVVIFPLGALILRVLHTVKYHAVVQALGMVLVCMATAGGIVISMQYNKSKNFTSAHQVIGILLLIALFFQLGLGILHHRIFKVEQKKTIFGKIHLYLGPAIGLVGIINAPIGFVFGGNPHLCLPYAVILILVVIVYIFVRFFAAKCRGGRRKKNAQTQQVGEGYQYPQFGQPPQYAESYAQPPPAYGRSESYREDVPLRSYNSQQSGLNAHPQLARPMV